MHRNVVALGRYRITRTGKRRHALMNVLHLRWHNSRNVYDQNEDFYETEYETVCNLKLCDSIDQDLNSIHRACACWFTVPARSVIPTYRFWYC
jgi:hypothetical protein